jgi:pilus assembly protein CpaB
VLVVMAARDIPEQTAISADSLMVQAFPADFVPQGAIPAPEQAVGKFTVTRLTKGQIVLINQLAAVKQVGNLALSVPPGKVAVALPMTDLLSVAGAVKSGDHVDILLTLNLNEVQIKDPVLAPVAGVNNSVPVAVPGSGGKNPVTQTTLQNVEILSVGVADTGAARTTGTNGGSNQTGSAIIVLLDHQDALVLKYVKDSGGIIDLALRAPDDTAQVKTDTLTIDLLFERFSIRRPQPVP